MEIDVARLTRFQQFKFFFFLLEVLYLCQTNLLMNYFKFLQLNTQKQKMHILKRDEMKENRNHARHT